MHASVFDRTVAKGELYEILISTLESVLGEERDPIANLANAAALVWEALPDINWSGFYILRGNELVLGPFQGRAACVRIPLGKGVCGTAAARRETLVVEDVHRFPGHIACDAASRSEIVVPLLSGGELLGVLDVDAPKESRFDEEDRAGLERVVLALVARLPPRF